MTARSDTPSARAPCVVGVGQVVSHSQDPGETEPLELWAQACSRALADPGSARGVRAVDCVAVVRCDSWSYDAPAQRLAARLGLTPGRAEDSQRGGCQPQQLLHTICDDIVGGRMDLGLIASGESLHTLDAVTRAGEEAGWSHPASAPPPVHLGEFFHESEVRHGMLPIMRSFALRDSARRARRGDDPEAYAREPAPIYAGMSEVAATNPYAWHRSAKSAGEILEVSAANRIPVRPYRKLMMAWPKVNQAAALLLASHARADALGVPPDRRVYVRGWSSAADHPYVAENEDLWRSRAMEHAARGALEGAALGPDDLGYFDLYSCFPSSLRFTTDALGRRLDDPRGVTVTGGMPYAGAPGSGYVMHALASMTERLREDVGACGLVSDLSAQMATHAVSVLSARPGGGDPKGFGRSSPLTNSEPRRQIRGEAQGPALLEAYAVGCDHSGDNEIAVAVCRLPDGSRCYAQTRDTEALEVLSVSEGVGRRVDLRSGQGGITQLFI
jgi:acetyl-CoA C-acetyltransferase